MRILPVLLFAAAAAFAGDVSGKWNIDGSVAGYELKTTGTLKQEEAKLTGTCKTGDQKAEEVTGEVTGDKVVFKHGGDYQGTALTITYSAKLAEDGTMKGDINVAPFDAAGDFTAKKGE